MTKKIKKTTRKAKPTVKKDSSVVRRTFAYSLNQVDLSFNLRTDIKQELKDFADLLKVATYEVDQELKSKK